MKKFFFLSALFLFVFTHQLLPLDENEGKSTVLKNGLKSEINFGFLHPASDADFTFLSGIYSLGFKGKIGDQTRIDFSIPLCTYTVEDNENTIGNLYAGIETRIKELIFEGGVFLPTTSTDNRFIGIISSNFDPENYPRYLAGTTTARLKFSWENTESNHLYYIIGFGTDFLFNSSDKSVLKDDNEVLLNYWGGVGFQNSTVHFSITAKGIFAVTEDIDDRFMHIIDFNMKYIGSDFQPGIFMKLPLSENLSDLFDFTFGVKFNILIN